MDNDQDPVSDSPVQQDQDTTDVNNDSAVEETVDQSAPAVVPPIPPQPFTITQSSFGRASPNDPMVQTIVSN